MYAYQWLVGLAAETVGVQDEQRWACATQVVVHQQHRCGSHRDSNGYLACCPAGREVLVAAPSITPVLRVILR